MYGKDLSGELYDIETATVDLHYFVLHNSPSQEDINKAHQATLKLLKQSYGNIPADCIQWRTERDKGSVKLTYYIELVKP